MIEIEEKITMKEGARQALKKWDHVIDNKADFHEALAWCGLCYACGYAKDVFGAQPDCRKCPLAQLGQRCFNQSSVYWQLKHKNWWSLKDGKKTMFKDAPADVQDLTRAMHGFVKEAHDKLHKG